MSPRLKNIQFQPKWHMIARSFKFMRSDFEKNICAASNHDNTLNYRFKEKYSLKDNYEFFRRALSAIYVIHEFGAHKYSYYSWQNTPDKSDACLENSIQAILRHVILYRTHSHTDESGINHVGHIVNRGGSMLLTRFYRLYMGNDSIQKNKTRTETTKVLALVNAPESDLLPLKMDQITSETMISVLKFKPEYIPSTVEGCFDVIDECLNRMLFSAPLEKFDPYNDICYADLIFWCGTFILNTLPEIDDQCKTYLEKLNANS